jgi:hypothetical protein
MFLRALIYQVRLWRRATVGANGKCGVMFQSWGDGEVIYCDLAPIGCTITRQQQIADTSLDLEERCPVTLCVTVCSNNIIILSETSRE